MKTTNKDKKKMPQQASSKKKDTRKQKPRQPLLLTAKSLRWFWLLPVVALVAVAVALLTFESDFLFRVQEFNLFLYTPLFFKQQMVVSGGLLTYVGTYFTQFFYHQWMGVALLCLWWLLLMWVLKRTFNIPAKWALAVLIPIALLLITDVDLGYWLYYLKLRGHFFVATIGTTAAVSLAWAYRSLPNRFFLRTIFIVFAVAAGYPFLGFYALLAALLMAVLAWRLDDYRPLRSGIDTLTALMAIGLVPYIYYQALYYQTNLANIYYTALPMYRIDQDYMEYYIPFYLLVAVLVVMAALYRRQRQSDVKRPLLWAMAQLVLSAILIGSVYHFWYKDENFHTELSMYRDSDNHQWENILTTYRNHDSNPSRTMWMMKNLALSRLGRQADEMYHYRNGDAP